MKLSRFGQGVLLDCGEHAAEPFGVFITRYPHFRKLNSAALNVDEIPPYGITSEPERQPLLIRHPVALDEQGWFSLQPGVFAGWQPSPSSTERRPHSLPLSFTECARTLARVESVRHAKDKFGEIGRVALQAEANYLIAG
jgi:hypothetical protein